MVRTVSTTRSKGNPRGARTSRKFKRRDEILKTATDLFFEKSYHDVTMNEIADRMGVAKGTIYNYFPSKENLYLEILEKSFELVEKFLHEEMEDSDSAPVKLRKLLAAVFTFYRQHLKVLKILSRDETHLVKEHFELTEQWRMARLSLYETIIGEGIEEGTFVSQDPRLRALMLYGAVGAVMIHHDFSRDPEVVADEVFSQLSSGLLVKKEKST